MSKPAEIAAMVKGALAQFGRIDVLVNNAGIQHTAPIQDFPPERWDAIIAINLSAAFHAIRLALAADACAQLGPHHQHRQRPWPGRERAEGRLYRGQARPRRADQGGGAGDRDHRRHLQRHLSGLGAHAAGAEADRRARAEGRHRGRPRPSSIFCRRSSPRTNSSRPSRSADLRCSCARMPPRKSAVSRSPSMAAGPRSNGSRRWHGSSGADG